MRHKVSVSVLLFMVLAFLIVPAMYGQVGAGRANPPIFQGPPGARPLALGGAFIGVADDATAAESNPAGLTILTRPEVSLHVIRESFEASDSSIRPSFASYVHPMRRVALSVYYSSGTDKSSSFDVIFGDDDFIRVKDDATLRRFGVAGAFRPFPMLSVGASVGLSRLSRSARINDVFPFDLEGSPLLVESDDTLVTEDSAINYNVGVVVNPAGRVSLGAVYKKEGKFDAQQTVNLRFCEACTLTQLQALPFEEIESGDSEIEGPTLWGAGLAVRPFSGALLALDYTTQKSRSTFSTSKQEIRAWRIGGEYVIAVPNTNYVIPVRAGYALEKDSDFLNSDFLREKAKTYSIGAGLVFGSNQIDIAFSRGHTITTNEKSRQIIVSGIRRF